MAKEPTAADAVIGERIRIRRKELGITQSELGMKLGITLQQIQKYEKGVNRVGGARLAEISKVFDVPLSYFFDADQEEDQCLAPEQKILSVQGATELLNAYARIADPALRNAVVSLARNLAQVDAAAKRLDRAANG